MKPIIPISLALFTFSTGNLAFAQNSILNQKTYEGQIGNSQIVLEILQGQKVKFAQYFYKSQLKNIGLEFSSDEAGVLNIEELPYACPRDVDKCESVASFKLKKNGDSLSGVWAKKDQPSKTILVNLKLISDRSIIINDRNVTENDDIEMFRDNEANLSDDPYIKRQLQTKMQYSKETKIGNLGYKIANDVTGISFPTLSTFPDKSKKDKINKLLEEYRLSNAISNLYCEKAITQSFGDGLAETGYKDISNEVIYLSERLMVIQTSGSVDCAGAHPSNFIRDISFDLEKVSRLEKQKLLAIYNPKPDEYGFWQYNPKFMKFLKSLNEKSKYFVSDGETYKECWGDVDYDFMTPVVNFTKEGVSIDLEDTPHAISMCQSNYFIIPYRDFKPWFTQKGREYFAKELGK